MLEKELLNESDFKKVNSKFILTGWGNYQSEISTFSDGTKKSNLLIFNIYQDLKFSTKIRAVQT